MALPTPGRVDTYDEFQFLALTGNTPNNDPTSFGTGVVNNGRLEKQVVWILSAAQLKALQTTAVALTPTPNTFQAMKPAAPGAGYALRPTRLMLEYIFNTTAYTIGNADNAFQIEHIGKSTNLVKTNATGLVDQASSQVIDVEPAVAGTVIALTNVVNLGLEIKLVGTTPALTLGDGLLLVILDYDVDIVY
jgi:hypothetical protein